MPDFRLDADGNYRAGILENIPWLRHGFGTRTAVLPDEPLATVKQIHSALVLRAEHPGWQGEADGLVSNIAGLSLGVKTADCVPILLADSKQRVVAAVHAGWRGTVSEIVRIALEQMESEFGTNSRDVAAAIGPAIGLCCFEVGPEVARQFAKWDARLADSDEKEHLDLAAINFAQLLEADVAAGNIAQSNLCTMCGTERFWSFRKEGESAGRMISWVRNDKGRG